MKRNAVRMSAAFVVACLVAVVAIMCAQAAQSPTPTPPTSVNEPKKLTTEQELRAENIKLKIQMFEQQKGMATCQQQLLAAPARALEAEILKGSETKFRFDWNTLSLVPADTVAKMK